MSDSPAVVRRILLHIAAPVLAEDTPPAAEELLVDEVSEALADLLETSSVSRRAEDRSSLVSPAYPSRDG